MEVWGEGTSKSATRRRNRNERLERERFDALNARIVARGAVPVAVNLTVQEVEFLLGGLGDDEYDRALAAKLSAPLPPQVKR